MVSENDHPLFVRKRTRGQHSPGRVSPFQVLLAKQGGAGVSTDTLGIVRVQEKNLSLAAAVRVFPQDQGSRKLVHIIDADSGAGITKKI